MWTAKANHNIQGRSFLPDRPPQADSKGEIPSPQLNNILSGIALDAMDGQE